MSVLINMNAVTFTIFSILCRLSLLIYMAILLVVKAGSMTGFDYIPLEFYIIEGLLLVFIIVLTWYQLCKHTAVKKRYWLRLASLFILSVIVGIQSVALSGIAAATIAGIKPVLMVLQSIFLLASIITLVGTYLKKI